MEIGTPGGSSSRIDDEIRQQLAGDEPCGRAGEADRLKQLALLVLCTFHRVIYLD